MLRGQQKSKLHMSPQSRSHGPRGIYPIFPTHKHTQRKNHSKMPNDIIDVPGRDKVENQTKTGVILLILISNTTTRYKNRKIRMAIHGTSRSNPQRLHYQRHSSNHPSPHRKKYLVPSYPRDRIHWDLPQQRISKSPSNPRSVWWQRQSRKVFHSIILRWKIHQHRISGTLYIRSLPITRRYHKDPAPIASVQTKKIP